VIQHLTPVEPTASEQVAEMVSRILERSVILVLKMEMAPLLLAEPTVFSLVVVTKLLIPKSNVMTEILSMVMDALPHAGKNAETEEETEMKSVMTEKPTPHNQMHADLTARDQNVVMELLTMVSNVMMVLPTVILHQMPVVDHALFQSEGMELLMTFTARNVTAFNSMISQETALPPMFSTAAELQEHQLVVLLISPLPLTRLHLF
jgi:hypothetical protein